MYQVEARVISNVIFFPDVNRVDPRYREIRLIWLNCPDIARTVQPGQFVMVRCDDLTLPRPLSVHQVINESIALLFTVLTDGKGTAWLAGHQPDDMVQVLGPLGKGFSIDKTDQNLLLVGGGMGIAPIYFLAQDAVDRGFHVTLLLGAQTDRLLYPLDRLPVGIELLTATDDGSGGRRGLVTSLISGPIKTADRVFACGPAAMYRQMAENRPALGLFDKPVQVSLEAIMGCGHGACYSCTIKTRHGLKQVCHDGPVFDLDDIVFGEMGL